MFRLFLVAQLVWVSLHAVVNSRGLINAWEFGGYAMYTTIPTDVVQTLVLVRPELEYKPRLRSVSTLRWWLEGGGCLLAWSDKRLDAVARDMARHGLDEVMVLFDKFDFADDKKSLGFVEMARLHATREQGETRIAMTGCGTGKIHTKYTKIVYNGYNSSTQHIHDVYMENAEPGE